MLKGQRCNVRHVVNTDLDVYIGLLNDMASRGPHFSTQLQSPEALRMEFGLNGFVTDEREMFLIEDQRGRIVGTITHFKSRTPISREIGYRLFDPALAGRGIMTEACAMLCDYLFRSYPLNRLELLMNPDNVGSERIAQKLGFEFEGTLRGGFFTNGAIRDVKIYGLLRAEWETAKLQTQAKM